MNDQIEMWWKCSACGTINGGLSKKCGQRVVQDGKVVLRSGEGCGKELDHQNWFMPEDISKHANITDSEHLAQAQEGADWMCAYCGSTVRNSKGECAVCGGDREFSTAQKDHTPPSVFIPQEWEDQPLPFKKRRRWILPVAISGAVALVAGILIWIFTPRYVEAQIQSAAWTGVIQIERFKRIHDEGWDAPRDAEDVQNRGRRVHHHDRVKVGSHQESYQERVACGQDCRTVSVPRVCTSNKNGTANCTGGGTRQECTTKYCNETRYKTIDDYQDVPRYRDWYSWYAWRWRPQRKVHSGGSDLKPRPPTQKAIRLNTGCQGREKERQSSIKYAYRCAFRDEEGETRVYEPDTVDKYQQCKPGRSAKLKLVAGSVSVEQWH